MTLRLSGFHFRDVREQELRPRVEAILRQFGEVEFIQEHGWDPLVVHLSMSGKVDQRDHVFERIKDAFARENPRYEQACFVTNAEWL